MTAYLAEKGRRILMLGDVRCSSLPPASRHRLVRDVMNTQASTGHPGQQADSLHLAVAETEAEREVTDDVMPCHTGSQ